MKIWPHKFGLSRGPVKPKNESALPVQSHETASLAHYEANALRYCHFSRQINFKHKQMNISLDESHTQTPIQKEYYFSSK